MIRSRDSASFTIWADLRQAAQELQDSGWQPFRNFEEAILAGIFYHVLLRNPLVAVVYSGEHLPKAIERSVRVADGAIVHLFVILQWSGAGALPELASLIAATAINHPNLHFTIMTATQEDDLLYRRSGLDSIWCNHNAFLDGRIFVPDVKAEKKYDAVYNGRLLPYKRHELAYDVPRMAVITYALGRDTEYARRCLAGYSHLQFVNYEPERGVTYLNKSEVHSILTQSRCGLALSREEGAMFASAEYLLVGLPVVTTPSKGGRHVFFHTDYVEVVEETPEAVASGVARIIAKNLDPWMIRKRTQERFLPHRWRLIMRLSSLAQTDLFQHAGANLWLPQFVDKLRNWVTD
jgi:glycosyltransferase involved in cell wall biosynthesis